MDDHIIAAIVDKTGKNPDNWESYSKSLAEKFNEVQRKLVAAQTKRGLRGFSWGKSPKKAQESLQNELKQINKAVTELNMKFALHPKLCLF